MEQLIRHIVHPPGVVEELNEQIRTELPSGMALCGLALALMTYPQEAGIGNQHILP